MPNTSKEVPQRWNVRVPDSGLEPEQRGMLRAVTAAHPQQNRAVIRCLLTCSQVGNRADGAQIFVWKCLGIFAMAVHPQVVVRVGLVTPLQQTPHCSTRIFVLLLGMSARFNVL